MSQKLQNVVAGVCCLVVVSDPLRLDRCHANSVRVGAAGTGHTRSRAIKIRFQFRGRRPTTRDLEQRLGRRSTMVSICRVARAVCWTTTRRSASFASSCSHTPVHTAKEEENPKVRRSEAHAEPQGRAAVRLRFSARIRPLSWLASDAAPRTMLQER